MLKTILLKVCEKFNFQNFKAFDFKKYFKFFSVFLILIIIGLALPRGFVNAGLLDIIGNLPYVVVYAVFWVLFIIAHLIAMFGALILDMVLNPAIINNIFASPVIYQGWTIIRDICNLLFLLIMILVAFGTIIQHNEFNIKNSLLKLIFAIFLINFSYTIAGIIIDFGNILMYGILGWMCSSPDACFSGYTNGLLKVVNEFSNTYSLANSIGWNGIDSKQAIGLAVATIYTFMLGFIFLALAAFLLVRIAGLALLLILAPFAYFGEVMPGMRKVGQKWWDKIWNYALFGPIFALMLYISGEMASITMAAPPFNSVWFSDSGLGFYSGLLTTIISNTLPLLFLLAIIPITKELGLAGSDTIMKNTSGLGERIGKFAGSAASDSWGRYVARGAGMQAKKGDSLIRRAYIKARNVGSITSPTAWKDAYKAKKSIEAHDYDAARGRIQDKLGWKSKYVESEQDRVTDAETHKAFGEMGIKGKDEMVYALKTAVREGNGPMVAEIMRVLAVNGDTDAGVDALNGNKGHTAEDYNKVMNEVIKPLLNAEKTAKLSNEIGKSEEKNNNFIYGGHDSYDSATNKYSMKDMVSGSEKDKENAKKEQQEFMIGRWNSKDEFSRIGTIGKTNFEGKDSKEDPSEEGAMFLGQLKGAEALKQVKRFKPKVAAFIAEKYAATFEKWKIDGKKEGTIFANMKNEDIETASRIHKRIVAIREGKYKDSSDETEEGEEDSSGEKGKKGGDGGGYAGGSAYTGGGGYTYSAPPSSGTGTGGKKSGGGGPTSGPISGGSPETDEQYIKDHPLKSFFKDDSGNITPDEEGNITIVNNELIKGKINKKAGSSKNIKEYTKEEKELQRMFKDAKEGKGSDAGPVFAGESKEDLMKQGVSEKDAERFVTQRKESEADFEEARKGIEMYRNWKKVKGEGGNARSQVSMKTSQNVVVDGEEIIPEDGEVVIENGKMIKGKNKASSKFEKLKAEEKKAKLVSDAEYLERYLVPDRANADRLLGYIKDYKEELQGASDPKNIVNNMKIHYNEFKNLMKEDYTKNDSHMKSVEKEIINNIKEAEKQIESGKGKK